MDGAVLMRISNLLDFSENHRFYTYRNFTLSHLDFKMLSTVYQPMIGAAATSLYHFFVQSLSQEKIGYSKLEQLRRLFLSLDIEMNELGRKQVIEQTSRLEAVGLLQSKRKYIPFSDEFVYEFALVSPLSPDEFFNTQHLTMLLNDKVGKFMVISFRKEFYADQPEEIDVDNANTEQLSVPFYELFRLNVQGADTELEQALAELAPARETVPFNPAPKGFGYEEIIVRFPRDSHNRPHVEALKDRPAELAKVNYAADKFMLSLQETSRLLDEDDIFSANGELLLDVMQQKASQLFWQTKKRSEDREKAFLRAERMDLGSEWKSEERLVDPKDYVPVPQPLQQQFDQAQYNALLVNEPYTRVLSYFYPGAVPPQLLRLFETVDLTYKLDGEVINALIHYLMGNHLSLNKPFIETIVSNLLSKRIDSFEKAVDYFRDTEKMKQKTKTSKDTERVKGKQKPKLPIASQSQERLPVSDERLEEIRRLAEKLK